jgi:hypothetical protein
MDVAVAHDGFLCTFSNKSATDRGPAGQVVWSVKAGGMAVHHVQNHTLHGHSPPASQAGRHVGPHCL